MRCDFIYFSEHAMTRMAQRGISPDDVEVAVQTGEVIKHYANDDPAPSTLILGFVGTRPIHVLISRDLATDFCLVITVYYPDVSIWESNFKVKK